jgi:peptidase E
MVEIRIEQDKVSFNKNKGSKNLVFKVASKEEFIKDSEWADIIYLHGGRTSKLMEILNTYQNLDQVFKDKIIGGDSAGANALGELFYSKNSKEIGEGLKILPFKIVVHYEDGIPNPLEQIKPELETIFLHEYEIKVFRL